MKRLFCFISLCTLALSCTKVSPQVPKDSFQYYADDEVVFMSFNVKVDATGADGTNSWISRRKACAQMIMDKYPTIIGVQEATYTDQWSWLKNELSDAYEGFGVDRDTGLESGNGEVMGILYNRNQVEKLSGGTFWLSETPDQVSKGWGASYNRTATWGIFRHLKTGVTFCYINTHLDHQVSDAQINGLGVIKDRFAMYNPEALPQFLAGDFNITADNVAFYHIKDKMKNARTSAPEGCTDNHTTYNNWSETTNMIIDHIYVSKELEVLEYRTVFQPYGGLDYISDHYPILAKVKIKN